MILLEDQSVLTGDDYLFENCTSKGRASSIMISDQSNVTISKATFRNNTAYS